ncbi:CesT family type III secretion system chaperone [Vibrio mangrovi]|uniref:CesT family type III secretion system chaperone n=1 Tax=Vibrio mangrovi TaxID=474394 RepID=A0A1Y6IYM5_9VIBR|nr:CesT family type III secretion system chaperone [Vibrio mangrovi]MDW6005429.1 CesT family type III secretion system chaperone [Vibrio mangrovi]SMS02131.1 Tir chaperone protein (CesT) [Vibrio mangrovi]
MQDFTNKINKWLQQYHKDLSLNSEGYCLLNAGDSLRIVISLSADKRALILYCPLHTVKGDQDFSLVLEALSLNLYQDITLNGTVGYDNRSQEVVYTFMVADSSFAQNHQGDALFHRLLNEFIENSQKIVTRLQQSQRSGDAPRIPASPQLALGIAGQAQVASLQTPHHKPVYRS